MLLQNIPTVPTLQINSHSPLHTPSLRSSRAHKLPSQASQPYLCYRQAVRCPYTGLPAQLFHEHSPKLSVGAAHPPQPSSGLCLASCSPTEPQSPRRPRNGKGVCPQGMQVSQKIPDTRMKCAFERLMPTTIPITGFHLLRIFSLLFGVFGTFFLLFFFPSCMGKYHYHLCFPSFLKETQNAHNF